MSTARTCTTPKDGWALYHHFLGNNLLVIASQGWDREEEENEDRKNKRERVIADTWAELVGNLYMIMRRMQANGHNEDAAKMQQIVDMTVELDLTDQAVRDAIHAKHRELYVPASQFEASIERLRAEHAK
ncbi:hypothetical protein KJ590_02410 [Patescibacteria group bacterium]|nr:hypothetical protein [Patescibacteria group bacterium]MBU4142832.1 hypothetical protein [Patescibacteria group bacterium]